MSKFVIACGGTGGHLSPGIALAEALVAHGHTVTLFISQKKVDTRLVEKYAHLSTKRVPGVPFSWRPDKHINFHLRQTQGLIFSLRFLRANRPDAIIGFGGFTNAGVVVAGRLLGIPVALHEANRVPGRAIRVLSRLAKRLYLPPGVRLPNVRGVLIRHTGLPVRTEIVRLPRDEARAQLGLDVGQRLLVVLGGSQGSANLNGWIEQNIPALTAEGVQIYCVTGLGKGSEGVREFRSRSGQSVKVQFESFSDRVGVLMSAADLVLSRAGAGTIAELVRCEAPAILIPYPFAADNHQAANALNFEQQGGGVVVAEQSLATLKQEVLDVIFNDWLLKKFRINLHRMSQENSIEIIVNDLQNLATGTMPARHMRHAPAPSNHESAA
ncbi:UDP-N-acetylglucosamine--N-acetylmuramyl-(pentapeptide) pyrophosphoryl-undecaprenol N-acetylglucosamine transferase [Oleiharenicola lentus]|uniref:UDP-N-acetylglucosamine--N-acetylmuramyl- (pentapeptide) pyrophosphoryl-undecaprenol N-acetylglucosamine transferase n=1 Tax=Oleiharenicola lentus TaxID=2508720 RepID=UPI003F67B99C